MIFTIHQKFTQLKNKMATSEQKSLFRSLNDDNKLSGLCVYEQND